MINCTHPHLFNIKTVQNELDGLANCALDLLPVLQGCPTFLYMGPNGLFLKRSRAGLTTYPAGLLHPLYGHTSLDGGPDQK